MNQTREEMIAELDESISRMKDDLNTLYYKKYGCPDPFSEDYNNYEAEKAGIEKQLKRVEQFKDLTINGIMP